MIDRLRELSLNLVVGTLLVAVSHVLESSFLAAFLKNNLVTLLVALLAINTTTSSVVMTKLREISDSRPGANFARTIGELRRSIVEQIAFVALAVLLSVLQDSPLVQSAWRYAGLMLSALLASVFVAALVTLYDTAKSIFVILSFENRKPDA